MSRFDDDRVRLEAARRRAAAREQYLTAERAADHERWKRGTRELRERFHAAVQKGCPTITAIRDEMAKTVMTLTLAHVRDLAHEAGLTVHADGRIERDKKIGGESR